jgi:hypothetical protein
MHFSQSQSPEQLYSSKDLEAGPHNEQVLAAVGGSTADSFCSPVTRSVLNNTGIIWPVVKLNFGFG